MIEGLRTLAKFVFGVNCLANSMLGVVAPSVHGTHRKVHAGVGVVYHLLHLVVFHDGVVVDHGRFALLVVVLVVGVVVELDLLHVNYAAMVVLGDIFVIDAFIVLAGVVILLSEVVLVILKTKVLNVVLLVGELIQWVFKVNWTSIKLLGLLAKVLLVLNVDILASLLRGSKLTLITHLLD